MHYIRFLKSPSVQSSKGSPNIHFTAKITVTTDLGESFACVELPLVVRVLGKDNRSTSYPYTWKRGYRQLEISVSSKREGFIWPCRLLVECQDDDNRANTLTEVLKPPSSKIGQGGRVLSLVSGSFRDSTSSNSSRKVQRLLGMSTGESLCIWEETGESIARHIWDAGLILSAYLESYIPGIGHSYLPRLPKLQKLLSKPQLKVLELGSGCGVVGIAFSKCFPKANVLLTDLPQAQEIALLNISALAGSTKHAIAKNVMYNNLEWGSPLPATLQNGDLDLVLVADCTYNPSVVPDLVKTLAAIFKHNAGVLILLAMKVRHDSELIFFNLMVEKEMEIIERLVLPLPLLGQDAEEIQIYVFSHQMEDKAIAS